MHALQVAVCEVGRQLSDAPRVLLDLPPLQLNAQRDVVVASDGDQLPDLLRLLARLHHQQGDHVQDGVELAQRLTAEGQGGWAGGREGHAGWCGQRGVNAAVRDAVKRGEQPGERNTTAGYQALACAVHSMTPAFL